MRVSLTVAIRMNRLPRPDGAAISSGCRGAQRDARNLRSPSQERSIRLMEEQFIHFPVRAEMELHPEALELVDDEGSTLVGPEFVGWLAPNCQHELSIVVLPDKRVVALWLNVPVQC
jgi:hypothetical protein